MAGKLYGVGVGPGDPELVTLKAKRILEDVDCIAVPKTGEESQSTALSIVRKILFRKKDIIELTFPMSYEKILLEEKWVNAAGIIADKLDEGKDVAFITLGDPTVYSTYTYIHKILENRGYQAEVIPGVASFCAAAAKAGISLAVNRETLAVVPSAYDCINLEEIIDTFDNIVLMKASKKLLQIKSILKDKVLSDNVLLVSRCGMDNEIVQFDLDKIGEKEIDYFTTIIIKKGGAR